MKNPPNALYERRMLSGYTVDQVAAYVGVKNGNTITLWEKGHSKPRLLKLLMLSALYGAMPTDLYPDLYQKIAKEMNAKTKQNIAKGKRLKMPKVK